MKQTLGQVIREARQELRILQKDLAKQLKISASYLSHIEKGRETRPSRDLLDKISELLDLDTDYLKLLCLNAGTTSMRISDSDDRIIQDNLWSISKILKKHDHRCLMAVSLHLVSNLKEEKYKHATMYYYRAFDQWRSYYQSAPSSGFGRRIIESNFKGYQNAVGIIGKEPPWSYRDITALPDRMRARTTWGLANSDDQLEDLNEDESK